MTSSYSVRSLGIWGVINQKWWLGVECPAGMVFDEVRCPIDKVRSAAEQDAGPFRDVHPGDPRLIRAGSISSSFFKLKLLKHN